MYQYITKIISEKNELSWILSIFDWMNFHNENKLTKKNKILDVLYLLNDLPNIDKTSFSFEKLKKSAQRYVERKNTDELKITRSNIRNLNKLSNLKALDPNEVLEQLIRREMNRIKNRYNE